MTYNLDLNKVSKMTHNRELPKVSKIKKKFLYSIKMLKPALKDLDPSSEELKEVAKILAQKRGIKGYKSMSEDELLSALISSKPVKKVKTKNKFF